MFEELLPRYEAKNGTNISLLTIRLVPELPLSEVSPQRQPKLIVSSPKQLCIVPYQERLRQQPYSKQQPLPSLLSLRFSGAIIVRYILAKFVIIGGADGPVRAIITLLASRDPCVTVVWSRGQKTVSMEIR